MVPLAVSYPSRKAGLNFSKAKLDLGILPFQSLKDVKYYKVVYIKHLSGPLTSLKGEQTEETHTHTHRGFCQRRDTILEL